MNRPVSFLTCILLLLLPLLVASCANGEQIPPRQWVVAEVNGIRPQTFVLDGKVHEDEPSIDPLSLLNFITPHAPNRVDYENGERYYQGSGCIGDAVFHDSFIIGYPICAFSYKDELFLISQFPAYKPGTHRIACGYYLYVLRDGRLCELVSDSNHGLSNGVELPRDFIDFRYTSKAADREKMLALAARLQFADSRLNYFAADWYVEMVCHCISYLDDAEDARRFELRRTFWRSGGTREDWLATETCKALNAQDRAYVLKELTRLVEYMEKATSTHPEVFAPDLARLMKEGYLFSPKGELRQPVFNSFYCYLNPSWNFGRSFSLEAPEIQALLRRLRCCWVSLLDKAEKGEITMVPECADAYRGAVQSIDKYLTQKPEKN